MTNKVVDKLIEKVDKLHEEMASLHLRFAEANIEIMWLRRILIGAASLGFIEKAIGWFLK